MNNLIIRLISLINIFRLKYNILIDLIEQS
jgi:hypothetical protein